MAKKHQYSYRLLADKFMDLANLIVGSLVISQIVTTNKSNVLLIGGIIIVIILYLISYIISI